ncbi:MAG: cytochrome P450, partial [Mycobacterium sp.]
SIFDLALPPIAYHDATDPAEVHRLIGEARAQGPVAMGPYGPELLTYDLVRSVLRDSRFAIPPGIGLVVQGITSGPVWDRVCKLLISLNGAEHQRLRRLVARAFTPRAAERMRAACVDVITELVDAQAPAGHCEVVTDIARPYPVPIICALLGAPREDWQLFSRWSDDLSRAFGCTVTQNESAIVAAWEQLESYVEELIARRRRSLGPGQSGTLISELIRAEDNGDKLTHDELVNLAVILLNAGTDTTRNQLAAAVQTLCEHPDQWELLANHPELAPQAVEELIRYSPITLSGLRVATEDVDLGDFFVPAGSYVIANTASANRDPAVFDEPERLDLTRQGAPGMMTFGGGVHYCLGAHLARVELREALRVITQRIANPRRTGPAPWRPPTELSGPTTLLIEFESAFVGLPGGDFVGGLGGDVAGQARG